MNEWESANTKRYTAEGLAVAGALTAGVAVYLWLHHDDERVVAPAVGNGFAGVSYGGRF